MNHDFRPLCVAVALALFGFGTFVRSGVAERVPLSNLPPGSVVGEIQVAAGSGRVVFGEGRDFGTPPSVDFRTVNLFSVTPDSGGPPIRLNSDLLGPEPSIFDWKVSPDGNLVAFVANLAGDSAFQIFVASTSQPGTQIPLDPRPKGALPGYDVRSFEFTPDSSRIVFIGSTEGGSIYRLASAPVTGAPPTILSTHSTGNDVMAFEISSDGSRVLYSGSLINARRELFVASTTASGTQQVVSSTVVNGNINQFFFLPNGIQAVYSGDLSSAGVREIFRNNLTPVGTQVKLNSALAPGEQVTGIVRPLLNQRIHFTSGPSGQASLKVNSGTPGVDLQLSSTPLPDGGIGSFTVQQVPGAPRLTFLGGLTGDGLTSNLYSSSTFQPNTQLRLSNIALGGGLGGAFTTRLTPDGSRAIYFASTTTVGVTDLFSASLDQAQSQVLLAAVRPGESFIWFELSPDGSGVLFASLAKPGSPLPLRTAVGFVPSDGSAPAEEIADLTGLLPSALPFPQLAFSPGGKPLVGADQLYEIIRNPVRVAPVLRLRGKTTIRSRRARVVLRGSATGGPGLQVEAKFRQGRRNVTRRVSVRPNGAWKTPVRATARRTVVRLQAADGAGLRSSVIRVRILRR